MAIGQKIVVDLLIQYSNKNLKNDFLIEFIINYGKIIVYSSYLLCYDFHVELYLIMREN